MNLWNRKHLEHVCGNGILLVQLKVIHYIIIWKLDVMTTKFDHMRTPLQMNALMDIWPFQWLSNGKNRICDISDETFTLLTWTYRIPIFNMCPFTVQPVRTARTYHHTHDFTKYRFTIYILLPSPAIYKILTVLFSTKLSCINLI